MPKGKRGAKRQNPKKYTLETPIVKSYIEFCACPRHLRPETLKTQTDFANMHGLKDLSSLNNYTKIDGFYEAVYDEQKKYDKHLMSIAKKGLLKRAKGMTVKRKGITPQGEVVEIEEELPPDVGACKSILTIVGDMREKHSHDVTSAGVSIFREAAEAEKRGGDKNG